jgi:hypothetical protein
VAPDIEFANSEAREREMEKSLEQSLVALLAREGLTPKPGDLEQFSEIIELYVSTLKTLHSVNLGDEEIAAVFRPEWARK